jgi:excinuclease ABC subunit C
MNLCSGPCINKISREDYMENIKQAKLVLNGKTKELKEILQKKMNNFSKEKNFEKAILIREKISSLNLLEEKQKMQRRKNYNEDIINYVLQDEKIYLMIFNIYKGTLENKKTFQFESKPNFLEEFLIQYYFENPIPKRIILPKKVENIGVYLSKLKNSKVEIFVPKKGELKKLLELVKMNIIEKYFEKEEILKELQKKLNLKKIPKIIECFDISHLGGTQVVGSMVQFRNAKPNKQNYRKFKIKAEDKNDDFSNMNEIIKRRYSKLKKENKTFPDLIVVDGGLGQLNSSLKALKEIEVKIPIISLAKKFEEIYLPNKEIIQLGEKNKARKLLEFIRNEAHRFAIKYQRERRRKSYFT